MKAVSRRKLQMALKIILCLIIVCELIGLATRSFGRLLKTFIFYLTGKKTPSIVLKLGRG